MSPRIFSPRTFSLAAVALASLAAAHPASAQVLFSDTFNTENGGVGQLNYNVAANSTTVALGSIYSRTFQLPVANSFFTTFTEASPSRSPQRGI